MSLSTACPTVRPKASLSITRMPPVVNLTGTICARLCTLQCRLYATETDLLIRQGSLEINRASATADVEVTKSEFFKRIYNDNQLEAKFSDPSLPLQGSLQLFPVCLVAAYQKDSRSKLFWIWAAHHQLA